MVFNFYLGNKMEVEQQVNKSNSLFSPASYNLPQFKYAHLPASEVRNAWAAWIRWFDNIMKASNIIDSSMQKAHMLAMGGLELQSVFYGIPDADVDGSDGSDPYVTAKDKLTMHFSPKQHESFERYQFWSMSLEKDEPIEKFLLRVQQKAEKCSFGKNETECRQLCIVDKIVQNASEDLRRKLLEKDCLTLDNVTKLVNAHQAINYQAEQMKPTTHKQVEINRLVVNKTGFPYYKDSGLPAFKNRCTRCGRLQHQQGETCSAMDRQCHRCKNFGHFQSMCKANAGFMVKLDHVLY